MMVRRPGKRPASAWCAATIACSSSPGWVLAATQTGRPESRPESWATARGSAGGGLASNLRLPATPTRGAPSRAEPLGVGLASGRGRARSGRAARARRCGSARPAPERALRHAAVDEDQRDAAPLELEDGVRPDLGLGDEREVRPPVVEEAADDSAARRAARTGARRRAAGGGRRARPRCACRR